VLGITCVLATGNETSNSTNDLFADPYDQQAKVEKLVKEHTALELEKADLE
jgi:hypothetical protein